MPPPALSLTATDRVLLHLRDHVAHADDREFPQAVTQKGISDATGLRLQHVPRTLKALEDRGFLSSAKGHVRGEGRRYKVYFLTGEGLEEAGIVLGRAGDSTVESGGGEARVSDLLAGRKGPVLPFLRELAGEDVEPGNPERGIAGRIPDVEGFAGREAELDELGRMLDDPKVRVMVVYASLGYGASTLAAKFALERAAHWSVAWVEAGRDLSGMLRGISDALAELSGGSPDAGRPESVVRQPGGRRLLLVLDNYYDASEGAVEYLAGLVAASKEANCFKLLVTAREDTPPYSRFYTIMDLHDGTVGEVHVRGLDIDSCRELLGAPDIDGDALRRLFQFTRGKPPTLKLLADGDEDALVRNTSFSREEIKLMLFLKGRRKKQSG